MKIKKYLIYHPDGYLEFGYTSEDTVTLDSHCTKEKMCSLSSDGNGLDIKFFNNKGQLDKSLRLSYGEAANFRDALYLMEINQSKPEFYELKK